MAVAARTEGDYKKVAALINGTGVGVGVTKFSPADGLWRPVTDEALEGGHQARVPNFKDEESIFDPSDKPESRISGSAIQRRTGVDPRHVLPEHPIWREVGVEMGVLAANLGFMHSVQLVMPTGGVGAGASAKYGWYMMEEVMESYRRPDSLACETQRLLLPDIEFIDPSEADRFEMNGAVGVMLDRLNPATA
jgi:hypothetical protein